MDQDLNYHNYFTEIETFFQSKRQNYTVRLSCLDWVLIENWKEQGVPLDAVLKGIERAFSSKKEINKLAYCVKAVEDVCKEQRELSVEAPQLPAFDAGEVTAYIQKLADQVERFDKRIAETIRGIDPAGLRVAEQTLSALEEKTMIALKREVDRELNPFRSNMTAPQIAMLEQQLWRRKLLEKFGVPRLSLFYLL